MKQQNLPPNLKRPLVFIPLTIVSLFLIWLLLSLYLANQAGQLIFNPERSYNILPPIAYEQEFFSTPSGEDIDAWYFPNPDSDKVILFLHGNSGRTPHFFPDLVAEAAVYAPSYPQFGLSSNKDLSQETVFETAEGAYDELLDKGYEPGDITVLGHSFGGAPSVYLASQHDDLGKLIVINSFSSVYSMCVRQYFFLCEFGRDLYPSSTYAQEITVPTEIYHYENDSTIPFEEGQKLFEAVGSEDKSFTELSGYTHAAIPFEEVFGE